MSFRNRIEEAAAISGQREAHLIQRAAVEASALRVLVSDEKRAQAALIEGEKMWFDRAIMPLFTEVASVLHVPMRNPFGRGLFGLGDGASGASIYATPDKNGFYREQAAGSLYWNVKGGEWSGKTSRWNTKVYESTYWDQITLAVHWGREGKYICEDIDLTSGNGVVLLQDHITELIRSGQTKRNNEPKGEGLVSF